MKPEYEIISTEDGSHSLKISGTDICFHSNRGALQESLHVFVQAGLLHFIQHNNKKPVAVLELGLGTGLNALLTAKYAAKASRDIIYHALDLYPLPTEIFSKLNYADLLNERELYKTIMQTGWNQQLFITPFFKLNKINANLVDYTFIRQYDIVYFDAFAPEDQEEMWTDAIFKKIFDAMLTNGVLVTYCSKSIVRKGLQNAGFMVEKLSGPPGKREIIRATKI